MMVISRSNWHARVYLWWRENKNWDTSISSVNLCPYVRTVLLWAPLRWLFSWGRVGRVRVPAIAWVTMIFGLPGVVDLLFGFDAAVRLLGIYFGLLMLLAMIVVAFSIEWFIKETKPGGTITDYSRERIKKPVASFFALLSAYFHAAHDRVCPQIEMEESRSVL